MFDDVAYGRLVDAIHRCFICGNSDFSFEVSRFYDDNLRLTNDVCFKIYYCNDLYASVFFIYLDDKSYFVFAKKHLINIYENLSFCLYQLKVFFKHYGIDLTGFHCVNSFI